MSSFFNAFRASARRTAFSAPRAPFRTSFRKFSTPPPEAKKSNSTIWLIAGLGAVSALGGGAYLISATSGDANTAAKSAAQLAKVKANFVPTKDDYQKVSWWMRKSSHFGLPNFLQGLQRDCSVPGGQHRL